jgi:hypothetical protein
MADVLATSRAGGHDAGLHRLSRLALPCFLRARTPDPVDLHVETGTRSSGKNGQVTSSLTVAPPGSGDFSCPKGQSLSIAQVTYSNVAITDTTNGVSEPISGTFSTGCLLPDVRGAC